MHFSTICKHIHVVHKYTAPPVDPNSPDMDDPAAGLDIKHLAGDMKPSRSGLYGSSLSRPKLFSRPVPGLRAGVLGRTAASILGTPDIIKVLHKTAAQKSGHTREVSEMKAEILRDVEEFGESMRTTDIPKLLAVSMQLEEAAGGEDGDGVGGADFYDSMDFPTVSFSPRKRTGTDLDESFSGDESLTAKMGAKRTRPLPEILALAAGGSTVAVTSATIPKPSLASSLAKAPSRILVVYPTQKGTEASKNTSMSSVFF